MAADKADDTHKADGAARPQAPRLQRGRRAARFVAAALGQQLSAAIFGVLLLAIMVASRLLWPEDALLARYDALLLAALALQVALIAGGWESWREARVIAVFHLVGTVMEIFKTAAGSWVYPEPGLMKLFGVPLFTGFMYAAVGSYIARSWRLLEIRLEGAPPFWAAAALAGAIYVNFFAHHYWIDLRWALMAIMAALFWRSSAQGAVAGARVRAPLIALFVGVGVLIWCAENIATWANIWLYPNQTNGWRPVSAQKIAAWTLLMLISFVLVWAVRRRDGAADTAARG